MTKLFGIPMGALAIVLVAALAATLGVVAVLALRNRVFLRLGVRNVRRRPGRSALIVVGLMLGTAIISAALATGDTMSQTIRSSAISSLGQSDEVISARGAEAELAVESGAATGARYFPEADFARVQRAAAGSPLIDGLAPAIIEPVAVQDARTRQNEPRVTLFASEARHLRGFGAITGPDGTTVSLGDLAPGEVYLNRTAGDELGAREGDLVRVLAGGSAAPMHVKAIVGYDGTGTDQSAVLMPLAPAQRLLGRPGRIKHVLVSNRGDATSGVSHTDDVVRLLRPVVAPLGLEADKSKQDALEAADASGAAFMSFFTTFGSFSIAAGILLIFLIFVMLAAERRAELGIARAVHPPGPPGRDVPVRGRGLRSARRGGRSPHRRRRGPRDGARHEGRLQPDERLRDHVLGGAAQRAGGLRDRRAARLRRRQRVGVAGQPDEHRHGDPQPAGAAGRPHAPAPQDPRGRRHRRRCAPHRRRCHRPERLNPRVRRLAPAAQLRPARPKGRRARPHGTDRRRPGPGRLVRAAGEPLALRRSQCRLFDLPPVRPDDRRRSDLDDHVQRRRPTRWALLVAGPLPQARADPQDVDRVPAAEPVPDRSDAGDVHPRRLHARRRRDDDGLVRQRAQRRGGVRGRLRRPGDRGPGEPDHRHARRARPRPGCHGRRSPRGLEPVVPAREAHQSATRAAPADYVVRGADSAFLAHTTYGLAARAKGFASAADVWTAMRDRPGLAVIDATAVPRRANFNFAALQGFRLSGFYLEDRTFAPVDIDVADPQSGRRVSLKVIGVLSETAPLGMAGITTSQRTLAATFGDRVEPTTHLFALKPGVDAKATAQRLESAFVANGMQAEALDDMLADLVSGSLTFDRLIMGFMGLGLIVGVAALGVVTARSVVERRQQIGVLRAIGFRRRMVQASFLLESSFIALTSIVVGTALGLAVAYNIIHDAQRQPSWGNLSFDVPWASLALIFAAVYAVALATTFLPALRASRVFPAEALRYQ